MADAASAATMGHTRISIAAGRAAALVPDACGAEDVLAALSPEELERMPEGFVDGVVAAEGRGALGKGALGKGALGKGAPEPEGEAPEVNTPEGDAPATEFNPVSKAGGGIAVEGSASAPVPHGTVCPFDCSVSVAGVTEPSAAAMVNRVTQVTLCVAGAVNW